MEGADLKIDVPRASTTAGGRLRSHVLTTDRVIGHLDQSPSANDDVTKSRWTVRTAMARIDGNNGDRRRRAQASSKTGGGGGSKRSTSAYMHRSGRRVLAQQR